jgi:DUF4097 and DUF4098 domain-containing protein YvlB
MPIAKNSACFPNLSRMSRSSASVEGTIGGKTMGGDINVDDAPSGADVQTMGGAIDITMVGDPEKGDRDVKLKSMSGDVALTVPAGLSVDLDITLAYTKESSRDYRIVSDFPIKLEYTKEWDHSQGSPREYIYGTGTIATGKHRIKIETTRTGTFT